MKRKNIFPLLAGIFLIYLLCRLTYNGGNQEGFIEGFLEGANAAENGPDNKCTEAGIKAYKAWKKCYDAYSNACSEEEAYKKYGFCKPKPHPELPCAELNRQFTFNHANLCSELDKKKQKAVGEFREKISQRITEARRAEEEEEEEEEETSSAPPGQYANNQN